MGQRPQTHLLRAGDTVAHCLELSEGRVRHQRLALRMRALRQSGGKNRNRRVHGIQVRVWE